MRVALVLRSGGIYTPKHVEALQRQIDTWLPGNETFCLTDVKGMDANTVPLKFGFPGWWSKIEVFRPGLKGDLLYIDLDTLIIGPLDDIANVGRLAILRDFYRDGDRRPEGLQSSIMYLPEADRAEVWEAFMRNPAAAMDACARGGDQQFLERFWMQRAARWQDLLPGQIVSYKVHCRNGVPSTTRVICAHGKPKFWSLPEYQHLYE